MIMEFQKAAINELQLLANYDRHSVLICGGRGTGKSYLAKQYASMLDIDDCQYIDANVSDVRSCINTCYSLDHNVVLVIENIDSGVSAVSNALLKFLEEPMSNTYIVVTARNIDKVADTIISRSAVVNVPNTHIADIAMYAGCVASQLENMKHTPIWKCVKSLSDVDTIVKLSDKQISYIESLPDKLNSTDAISTQMWVFSHYEDNTEMPSDIVIRYIVATTSNSLIRLAGMSYIKDIDNSRIAKHVVLAKFLMECKYCS